MQMEISAAHIKQLAAVGYSKQDICDKFEISMFQMIANYLQPFREGQKIYVQKEIERYRQKGGFA